MIPGHHYTQTDLWLIHILKKVGWSNKEVGTILGRTKNAIKHAASRYNLIYNKPPYPQPAHLEERLEKMGVFFNDK